MKKKFFGGFDIMVQERETNDSALIDQPKKRTYFRKAKEEDLVFLGLICSNLESKIKKVNN